MKTLIPTLLLVVCWTVTAAAEEPAAPSKRVSLTISPIHLSLPMLEVAGELAIGNAGLAIGALAGVGSISQDDGFGGTNTFTIIELGASPRYYVLGDFEHGMQVGAELAFLAVSGENDTTATVGGSAGGLSIGPYIGYKFVAGVGFTFEAQLGAGFVAVAAEASDSATGQEETASGSDTVPILNLNVGWSF